MEEKYYIRNRGFVGNCLLWWGPNSGGYTTDIAQAGLYTKEEAEDICRSRPKEDAMYPSHIVEQHIVQHVVGLEWPS